MSGNVPTYSARSHVYDIITLFTKIYSAFFLETREALGGKVEENSSWAHESMEHKAKERLPLFFVIRSFSKYFPPKN